MKVSTQPIQDGWTKFAEKVLPAGTPKIQRVEMRRAFFAGACFLFGILTTEQKDGGILDPGLKETDRDLQQMAALEAEIRKFGQSIREGEA